jgi:hypothetical protein
MARLRRMLLTLAVAALLLVGMPAWRSLESPPPQPTEPLPTLEARPKERDRPFGGALRWLMLQLWVPPPGATLFCGDPYGRDAVGSASTVLVVDRYLSADHTPMHDSARPEVPDLRRPPRPRHAFAPAAWRAAHPMDDP